MLGACALCHESMEVTGVLVSSKNKNRSKENSKNSKSNNITIITMTKILSDNKNSTGCFQAFSKNPHHLAAHLGMCLAACPWNPRPHQWLSIFGKPYG